MYFQKYRLSSNHDGYEVILYIEPHHSLEEFAEEFGFTKKTENDIGRIASKYVKNKFPNLKVKQIKVMLGGVLISSVMFGGTMTNAFAAEHDNQPENETVDNIETVPEEEPLASEPTPEEPSADLTGTEEETETQPEQPPHVGEEVPMEEPGLIPSDFFYFVEIVAEKIQLALTFGDTAKAELISTFANERIAEANLLFENGDTDGAIELLNKALESNELALNYVTENDDLDPSVEEGEITPEVGDVPTDNEDLTEEEEQLPGEDTNEEENVSDVRDELQTQFSRNITALLLAMEKVENPKAKAALAKNVEKAFAKMERKLGKIGEMEERLTSASISNDDVEALQNEIREDQKDFESSMSEVEENATTDPVVPPGKEQGKSSKVLSAQKENAQSVQEKTNRPKQVGQDKSQEARQEKQENKNIKRDQSNGAANEIKEKNANKQSNSPTEKGKGNISTDNKLESNTHAETKSEVGKEASQANKNDRAKEKANQGEGKARE